MIKRLVAGLACATLSAVAFAGLATPANAVGHTVRCIGSTAHIYGTDGTYYGYILNSRQCGMA